MNFQTKESIFALKKAQEFCEQKRERSVNYMATIRVLVPPV